MDVKYLALGLLGFLVFIAMLGPVNITGAATVSPVTRFSDLLSVLPWMLLFLALWVGYKQSKAKA